MTFKESVKAHPERHFVDSPGHMANTEWLFRKNKNDGAEAPTVTAARKRRAAGRSIFG